MAGGRALHPVDQGLDAAQETVEAEAEGVVAGGGERTGGDRARQSGEAVGAGVDEFAARTASWS